MPTTPVKELLEIGYRASHLCKLGLEFGALVTAACYDNGDLVMALMGNDIYGSPRYREKKSLER